MSIESDADRRALLEALGETIRYEGKDIVGVFEKRFSTMEFDASVESHVPEVTVRSSDVQGVSHGDSVIRASTSYTVERIEPDGTGLTVLGLREV